MNIRKYKKHGSCLKSYLTYHNISEFHKGKQTGKPGGTPKLKFILVIPEQYSISVVVNKNGKIQWWNLDPPLKA